MLKLPSNHSVNNLSNQKKYEVDCWSQDVEGTDRMNHSIQEIDECSIEQLPQMENNANQVK